LKSDSGMLEYHMPALLRDWSRVSGERWESVGGNRKNNHDCKL